ncbi:MAG: YciI family protein [Geminicoccaceae bacterium]
MQWLIIARDGNDQDAPKRRLAARPAHLENAAKLQTAGHLLIGGALIDDDGAMIGTAAIAQFATRAELDEWLQTDPYVTGNVWQDIEVHPYRVAPHYDIPACPEPHDHSGDAP